MLRFLPAFALTYVGCALGLSLAAHLGRPAELPRLLRRHGLVPSRWVVPIALLVVAVELFVAVGVAARLIGGSWPIATAALLATASGLGVLYTLYIRRLLETAPADTPCGCTPFAGRLTSASYLPAVGLAAAGICGAGTAWIGGESSLTVSATTGSLLPILWGTTLAVAVALVPATVPGRLASEEPA